MPIRQFIEVHRDCPRCNKQVIFFPLYIDFLNFECIKQGNNSLIKERVFYLKFSLHQGVFCWFSWYCNWNLYVQMGWLWTMMDTEDDTPVASWMQSPKCRHGLKDKFMSLRKREINTWRPHTRTLDDYPVKLTLHTIIDGFWLALNYTAVLLWTKEQINLRLFE